MILITDNRDVNKDASYVSKVYRRTHLPAFLLLFLSESADYGAGLMAKLRSELPFFLTDSSSVYRSLQELEEKGQAEAQWKISEDGVPRKWYSITPAGYRELEVFYEDIRKRQANLLFFLQRYPHKITYQKEEE